MNLNHLVKMWGTSPHIPQFAIVLGGLAVLLIVGIIVRRSLRKEKVNTFLFNNNYHSVNPRTSEVLFPKVSFKKDRIILKKCMRKTVDQISHEKNLWEQTFNKEIGYKKIAGIEARGNEITMSLI